MTARTRKKLSSGRRPASQRRATARTKNAAKKSATPRHLKDSTRSRIPAEADLATLSELSSRLWRSLSLESGLDEILATAMKLLGAPKGNVQLLKDDVLRIATQSGFDRPFLDHFRTVSIDDDSACARALRLNKLVIIDDVDNDRDCVSIRDIARQAHYRAVVSTPLCNSHGTPVGALSTYFTKPHCPAVGDLFRLEQYVRQAGDFIQRYKTEDELRRREEQIRAILDATADALVTIDLFGKILTFNHAAERIFGYSSDEVEGRNVNILLPSPDRDRHDEYLARYRMTGVSNIVDKTRDLIACRKNGETFPIRLRVRQVDHRGLFVGSVRDMTEQQALQEEVLRIDSLEQQRIGQELHDGIQQELTGLGLLAQTLTEQLQDSSNSVTREIAARLAGGIERANQHVQFLARGMVPITIDKAGVMSALAELAANTQSIVGVPCRFECTQPVVLASDEAATHLFRIAQEALGNAIKHADAKSLLIRLQRHDDQATLDIIDDGIGIDAEQSATAGVGLRLMAHRTALISGALDIHSNVGGGTTVTCSAPLVHYEQ